MLTVGRSKNMALADDIEVLTCNRLWVPPANDPLGGVVQDYEIRSSIAHAIGEMKSPPPEAIAALIYATLNDENDTVSTSALAALVRVADAQTSLPVAIAATFHKDELVRESALEHIASIAPDLAKVVARRLLSDADEGVVRTANVIVAGKWGGRPT